MNVLSNTVRQIELAVQLDGAASYLLPLARGMKKIYDDGHCAHRANPNTKPSQKKRLADCEACSQHVVRMGEGPLCLDNDAWKEFGDRHDFGELKPSVDLLLFVDDAGHEQLVMVEAKLGSATRRKGDAPRRPSQVEIREKYEWSAKRVGGKLTIHRDLRLLVSSNTLQKMRQKVNRWNRSDSAHPIVCSCCSDFLSEFGIALANPSMAQNCPRGV